VVQLGVQVVQSEFRRYSQGSDGTVRGAGGTVRIQVVQLKVQMVLSGFRWYR